MTRSLTFGQAPAGETHVHIDDPYASTMHCRIEQRGNRFWVEDLGSTNGTFVVRQGWPPMKVTVSMTLLPGDKVHIGRTTLPWEAQ